MNHLSSISIIIHTRNRPDFLFRLLTYYDRTFGASGISIFILDASDLEHYERICGWIEETQLAVNVRLLHHDPSTLFSRRFLDVLSHVATPYVMLAADDDFFFSRWLEPAVALLESDPSYGVVYGHTIRFQLEEYVPYSKLLSFGFNNPNPPIRWLEGVSAAERLEQLGRSNWATTGWYALQRTDLLRTIAGAAWENGLEGYYFERLLIFCQAALGKTRKLDAIGLSRQLCDEQRPPYSFETLCRQLPDLMNVSASMLVQHAGYDSHTAVTLVNKAYRAEIEALKRNDRKRFLRSLTNAVPWLRRARNAMHSLAEGGPNRTGSGQDARLPPNPSIDLDHEAVKEILRVVSGEETVSKC